MLMMIALSSSVGYAATYTLTTSFTQDGGVYVPPTGFGTDLQIDDASSPVLSLTNGAGGNGVYSVVVGVSQSGNLLIDTGSTFATGRILGGGSDPIIGLNSGSTGAVTVSGVGSTWIGSLTVGWDGSASLLIADGAMVSGGGIIGLNSGSTGAVTVSGTGSTWIGDADVGWSGSGSLLIANGGAVTGYGQIAVSTGSSGVVTVSGAGSAWTTSGQLLIGAFGTGRLNILDGGVVTGSNGGVGEYFGMGAATVSGQGSAWNNSSILTVGYASGTGSLSILSGGKVSAAQGGVGSSPNSVGTVTVSGTNSAWTLTGNEFGPGNLYLGYGGGTGTLIILAGGTVSDNDGNIGLYGSTSDVTVDGLGSAWTNSGNLYIGFSGTGILNITGGATVTSNGGYLGLGSGAVGTVSVSGVGSVWINSGNLLAGSGGAGLITVASGGTVNVGGTTTISLGSQLNVASGGTFSTSNLMVPGQLTNNGQIHGNVTVANGGVLAGNGAIAGTLTMSAGSTYAPGNSPGLQTVNGDVTWNSLTYRMEIADVTAAAGVGYDSLDIHAAGSHVGKLDIVSGSTINVDLDSYPASTSVTGFNYLTPFDLVLVSTEGGINGFAGATFVVDWSAFELANGLNGGVFSVIQSINGNDLLLHYTAVPEPGSLLLLLTAAAPLAWRLRRRRRLVQARSGVSIITV
jgi:T5SS/PEP-CTERM-associated repeat protein